MPSTKPLPGYTKAKKVTKTKTKKSSKPPKKILKQIRNKSRPTCTVSESHWTSDITNSEATTQPRYSSPPSTSASSSSTSFVVKQPKPFSLNKEPYSTPETKITHSSLGTTPSSEVSDFVSKMTSAKSDLTLQMTTPPTTKIEPISNLSIKTEVMDTKISVDYLWKMIHDTNFGVYNFEKLMEHLCNLGIGDEIMFRFFMQNTDVDSEEMKPILDCLKPWPRRAFSSYFRSANSGP